jgi:hypothetical protein
MAKPEIIKIDDVEYVRKDQVKQPAFDAKGRQYVIVRGQSSGAFAGYLGERNGREVELFNVRRLWYWEGAASLSQIAIDGVKRPDKCRFPAAFNRGLVLDAIEVIDATESARNSIEAVAVWAQ